ncbi:hypothetical protein S7335_3692 [Synechococcus sp. PCC 7335]|nr:hypothetical protein S7335_3692 [Synechococcus sp. PCC 7335]
MPEDKVIASICFQVIVQGNLHSGNSSSDELLLSYDPNSRS